MNSLFNFYKTYDKQYKSFTNSQKTIRQETEFPALHALLFANLFA